MGGGQLAIKGKGYEGAVVLVISLFSDQAISLYLLIRGEGEGGD